MSFDVNVGSSARRARFSTASSGHYVIKQKPVYQPFSTPRAASSTAAMGLIRPAAGPTAFFRRCTSGVAPLRCRFHSADHPPPAGPFGAAEQAILAAAYRHVPACGFSMQALALGAKDAGYLDTSTNVLPDGAFSLVRWHLVTRRKALAARSLDLFSEPDAHDATAVSDKVRRLTWERLMGNRDVVAKWQEVRTGESQSPCVFVDIPADGCRSPGTSYHGPADLCSRVAEGALLARRRNLLFGR